jgi:DNA-directed RNA polymerase subunit beta'
MRGTIVPDPSLNLDEVGLPRKAASEMYKPFTVARMVKMGIKPLEAQRHIKEDTPTARRALEIEANERPVLLKRDPVLHKQGVQAFRPRLVEGKTIQIHPLVTSGYNADFDGDTMSAFVPVTAKAVKEAHKMFPSNNLFSQSWGDISYKPDHEAALGIFKLSEMGKKTKQAFNSPAELAKAVHAGKVGMTDVVTVKNVSNVGQLKDFGPEGKLKAAAKPVRTTMGRLLINSALPAEVREDKILTDPKYTVTKKVLSDKLAEVARKKKSDYAATTDHLKDLGNDYSTGFSMDLEDFSPNRAERDRVLRAAQAAENKIRANKKLTKKQRDDAVVGLYSKADEVISDRMKKQMEASGNRMYDWVKSGSRGSWDQFKQLAVAPMLVLDSSGKTVPVPITKSYSEGLDAGGYWAAMHGARMGMIGKGRGTELPGALSKQMISTSINQVVTEDDCETSKGITFNVDDTNALDRFTTKEIKLGKKSGKDKGMIPAGTLVTPDVLRRLKNNKVKEVPVRTPLKCAHGEGICAKCMGLNEDGQQFPKGDNVGIKAAQALGEPTTQLVLRSFHEGGVAGSKSAHAVGQFDRLKQLVELPEKVPGAATLSTMAGKVEKIDKDPAGGWNVQVGGQRHFVPARRDLTVKSGQAVKRGDALSSGPKNPRQMLPLTGVGSVQRYLTDEIVGVYNKKTPLHRRNAEVVVRALTNLSVVNDPGSHTGLLKGDSTSTSEINTFNSKIGTGKKPVQHTPVLKGVNIMPLEMQTDWLARMQATRLKNTLEEGASQGWASNLHGRHPIPGMAYGKEFGLGTEQAPWLY